MVALPPEYVISTTLSVGAIYKFEAREFLSTNIPHHFIVVAIDGNDNFLLVCTSQQEKKEEYFDRKKIDYKCLVWIKPDSENGLTKDSFVNCTNTPFLLTKEDLVRKCKEGVLTYTGMVSYNHYDQIRTGIMASYENDLPEEILKHECDDQ